MAKIHFPSFTGQTNLYAQRFEAASDQVWDGSGYVTFDAAGLASYKIPLTELGNSGHYFSADFTLDRTLDVLVFAQAGGAPAASDVLVGLGEIADIPNLVWQSLSGKKVLSSAAGRWVKDGDYLHLYDTDNTAILVTLLMQPSGGPYTSATPV